VASEKYATCCLLGCKFLTHRTVYSKAIDEITTYKRILAVAATDGHVVLYRVRSRRGCPDTVDLSLILKIQIHQSSVKCMDKFALEGIHLANC
jgi:hypothetical protein